jgi:hypothetical protein
MNIIINDKSYEGGAISGYTGFLSFLFQIDSSDLDLGDNKFQFRYEQTSWYIFSDVYSGPFVQDRINLFKLTYYQNTSSDTDVDKLYVAVSTISKSKEGIVYFIVIDQNDVIYSAPDWSQGIAPLGKVLFPANFTSEPLTLIDFNESLQNPPFYINGYYTFGIAAFDPVTYEPISNIESISIKLKKF